MREILFRGKHIVSEEWVEGSLKIFANGDCSIFVSKPKSFNLQYAVYPETVGQFTGLTDKNGTKIFEGDILKTQYGTSCVMKWYKTNCYSGYGLFLINTDNKQPFDCNQYDCDRLEIIGNRHDNPELIGGVENDNNA